MEFDELQQIWDMQNNKPLYVINESAMQNLILSKLKQAHHITQVSELLLIIVNGGAGSFILIANHSGVRGNVFIYLMAAWLLATSLYVLISRIRRIKGDRRFDRSMHGDLRHAISVAAYQVRLSQIMRLNNLPIGALIFLSLWESGKPFLATGLTLSCLALAYYAGAREHRIYKARKRELGILQKKLETNS